MAAGEIAAHSDVLVTEGETREPASVSCAYDVTTTGARRTAHAQELPATTARRGYYNSQS